MSQFLRKIEDFTCENCGKKVKGTGYTNHCPNCLFSKHVDINPGDREETCGGLMEPVFLELLPNGYRLTHLCLKCGAKTHCKTAPNDSVEALAKLSESLAKNTTF